MKRLGVLLGTLFVGLGCAGEGDKAQWDEFWKDLRGENMEMKSDFSAMRGMQDSPAAAKPAE